MIIQIGKVMIHPEFKRDLAKLERSDQHAIRNWISIIKSNPSSVLKRSISLPNTKGVKASVVSNKLRIIWTLKPSSNDRQVLVLLKIVTHGSKQSTNFSKSPLAKLRGISKHQLNEIDS